MTLMYYVIILFAKNAGFCDEGGHDLYNFVGLIVHKRERNVRFFSRGAVLLNWMAKKVEEVVSTRKTVRDRQAASHYGFSFPLTPGITLLHLGFQVRKWNRVSQE